MSMVAVLAAALAACDTVTDLGEVQLDGEWYSVGALQQSFDEQSSNLLLRLTESEDGTIAGTWELRGSGAQVTGSNDGGTVQFTLLGFSEGAPVAFAGRLTNRFRLEGDLNGYALDGPAVFRFHGS